LTWRLPDGTRDILGLWIDNTEGAKFWLKVFNLIAVTDGLKGIAEALEAVFPATTLQTCIVHLICGSLSARAARTARHWLPPSSRSTRPPARGGRSRARCLRARPLGQKFPTVVAAWRGASDRVISLFAFPPAVRRVIYTTNAIESVNARLRKIIKTRGHFPSDEAASKLIWLALRNITAAWGYSARNWIEAMNHFVIFYAERFTRPLGYHCVIR
jgi:transposase-like protein